ncbi:hypothetical protein [Sideroxydans lithotrophicus]|uniref:Uncharacterized protein n=1 Tax=Sideroxydans lithotrophicus (strain ES-1) TaxID=580332 RepID=D5CT37_SIDLE|nr:hypothetical protein [Sideroxydans lithotrophicus]ADE12123.1 hypothetical protein Slit_1894 [Sideroxydans lithotrophicus ES-1]
MGFAEWTIVGLFVLGLLTGAIGWLLANKDAKQEEMIKELFLKHDEDAKKLAALEIDIARNYNPKHEITGLFDNFKLYLNERFDRLEQAVGVERRHHE